MSFSTPCCNSCQCRRQQPGPISVTTNTPDVYGLYLSNRKLTCFAKREVIWGPCNVSFDLLRVLLRILHIDFTLGAVLFLEWGQLTRLIGRYPHALPVICRDVTGFSRADLGSRFQSNEQKGSTLNHQQPQWGAGDAEIKVPSGENAEFKRSPFKAWSRSVYSHTCYAYCQGFLPRLFLPFQSIHLHFF